MAVKSLPATGKAKPQPSCALRVAMIPTRSTRSLGRRSWPKKGGSTDVRHLATRIRAAALVWPEGADRVGLPPRSNDLVVTAAAPIIDVAMRDRAARATCGHVPGLVRRRYLATAGWGRCCLRHP